VPGTETKGVIRGFRREQVVTTALQLIGRRGTPDVSVEEIAAEAGVSRATVYNHFRDREEILAVCAAWAHRRLEAAMEHVLQTDAAAEDLLSGFLAAALAALDENPGFYRLTRAYRGAGGPGGMMNEELEAAAPRGRALFERLVQRLATTGSLRVDEATAASAIGVVLVGALERRASEVSPGPVEGEARVLADVVLNGLSKTRRRDR